jgi:hypothetical protein
MHASCYTIGRMHSTEVQAPKKTTNNSDAHSYVFWGSGMMHSTEVQAPKKTTNNSDAHSYVFWGSGIARAGFASLFQLGGT